MGKEISKFESNMEERMMITFDLIGRFEERLESILPECSNEGRDLIHSIILLLKDKKKWVPPASIPSMYQIAEDLGLINNNRPRREFSEWTIEKWKRYGDKFQDSESDDEFDDSDLDSLGKDKIRNSFYLFHKIASVFTEGQFELFRDVVLYFLASNFDFRIYLDNKAKPKRLKSMSGREPLKGRFTEEEMGDSSDEEEEEEGEEKEEEEEVEGEDEAGEEDEKKKKKKKEDISETEIWMREIAERFHKESLSIEKEVEDLKIPDDDPVKEKKLKKRKKQLIKRSKMKKKLGDSFLETLEKKKKFDKTVIDRVKKHVKVQPIDLYLILLEFLKLIQEDREISMKIDPKFAEILDELHSMITGKMNLLFGILDRHLETCLRTFIEEAELVMDKFSIFGKVFLGKLIKAASLTLYCYTENKSVEELMEIDFEVIFEHLKTKKKKNIEEQEGDQQQKEEKEEEEEEEEVDDDVSVSSLDSYSVTEREEELVTKKPSKEEEEEEEEHRVNNKIRMKNVLTLLQQFVKEYHPLPPITEEIINVEEDEEDEEMKLKRRENHVRILDENELGFFKECIENEKVDIFAFKRIFRITVLDAYWIGAIAYEVVKKVDMKSIIFSSATEVFDAFNFRVDKIPGSEEYLKPTEEEEDKEDEKKVKKKQRIPEEVVEILEELEKNLDMFIRDFGMVHNSVIGTYLRHQRLMRNLISSALLFGGAYFLGRKEGKRIFWGVSLILSSFLVFWVNSN